MMTHVAGQYIFVGAINDEFLLVIYMWDALYICLFCIEPYMYMPKAVSLRFSFFSWTGR
jgi:hypothetical protein